MQNYHKQNTNEAPKNILETDSILDGHRRLIFTDNISKLTKSINMLP